MKIWAYAYSIIHSFVELFFSSKYDDFPKDLNNDLTLGKRKGEQNIIKAKANSIFLSALYLFILSYYHLFKLLLLKIDELKPIEFFACGLITILLHSLLLKDKTKYIEELETIPIMTRRKKEWYGRIAIFTILFLTLTAFIIYIQLIQS
jgi:hypothetical protein